MQSSRPSFIQFPGGWIAARSPESRIELEAEWGAAAPTPPSSDATIRPRVRERECGDAAALHSCPVGADDSRGVDTDDVLTAAIPLGARRG